MIVNLPPDTLQIQNTDEASLNVNEHLSTERTKQYIWKLFMNDSKLNSVQEIEEAFRQIIVCHYAFMSDLDTVNYAKMLEIFLKTLIKSDIFNVVSVEYNILNCVLNGKNIHFNRASTSTTIISRFKQDGKYHSFSTSIKDTDDRSKYYLGPFIVNFTLNGQLKHCAVSYTVDGYGDKETQPECKMIGENEYNKFKNCLDAVLTEYPQYDIKPTIRNYDETIFLKSA